MDFSASYIILECRKVNRSVLSWLASLGLLKNERTCNDGHIMRLVKSKCKKIGHIWECKNPRRLTKSVCCDSIFEDSSLSLEKVMLMVYYWAVDYCQKDIIKESRVNCNAVSQWCDFFRDVVAEHMVNFNQTIGGMTNEGLLIEAKIDKSQFFKRKSNKGRIGNPIWVFGGIERGSRR